MKQSAIFIAITAAALCATMQCSCSRNIPKDDKKEFNETKVTDSLKQSDYDPQFEKEGFIAKNVYRVVIVTDKNFSDKDLDSVKETAQKRSLTSLQKYLQSQNKSVTQNTTAHLLNLILDNGALEMKKDLTDKHTVFFFDVKKSDVKRYVDSLPQK